MGCGGAGYVREGIGGQGMGGRLGDRACRPSIRAQGTGRGVGGVAWGGRARGAQHRTQRCGWGVGVG